MAWPSTRFQSLVIPPHLRSPVQAYFDLAYRWATVNESLRFFAGFLSSYFNYSLLFSKPLTVTLPYPQESCLDVCTTFGTVFSPRKSFIVHKYAQGEINFPLLVADCAAVLAQLDVEQSTCTPLLNPNLSFCAHFLNKSYWPPVR